MVLLNEGYGLGKPTTLAEDGYRFGAILAPKEGWDGKCFEINLDIMKVDEISDHLKGIIL